MKITDSQSLLSEYAKTGSEPAFRELLMRYMGLVYSTAVRLVGGDTHLAQDVSQTVFADLARKATSLPQDVMLGGWLHHHTVFVAATVRRAEHRRRRYERRAVEMNTLEDHSEANLADVAPVLDEAIDQLGAEDRTAILLRFFEQLDLRSVGQALGSTEEAARKRVTRALEKLHALLGHRGVSLSAAALGTILATRAVTAAPAGLPGIIAKTALIGSGTPSLTLLSKYLILMCKTKLTAIAVVSALGLVMVGIYFSWTSRKDKKESTVATSAVTPEEVERPTPTPVSRPNRTSLNQRSSGDATAKPDPNDLEEAKGELRRLLGRPQQRRQYPPPELAAALAKFGDQWLEALPILLERLGVSDFETRHWALSGIWHLLLNGTGTESLTAALATARPSLAAIFRSEEEPIDLRRLAYQALLPSLFRPSFASPFDAPLQPETAADIASVLRSTDKNSRGLQFELVDPLLKPESQNPPDYAQAVRDAVTPLLRSDSIAQRLLAAYSLAVIPGEKPPELKDIFLEVLQLKGTTEGLYAYRAADGLGLLGPQAKDAVPALLDFANATKDWGASGYAQAALEAACRIEPALRQEYPQIDAKLKQQESGNQPTAIPIPTGQTETPSVNGPEPSSPPLLGLTLDARVLLIDYPTPDKSRLETLLSEWDNYYRSIPGYAAVTTERFNELSQTIEKIDTNFHALWLKEILRSYPNLDRRASVPKK